jgi:hypothetical protein
MFRRLARAVRDLNRDAQCFCWKRWKRRSAAAPGRYQEITNRTRVEVAA